MRIFQSVANQQTVFVILEEELLFQNDTAHTIDGGRHLVAVELANVLVTFRAVVVALILVESQIEFCTMLDNCTIQRTQQHMIVIVQFGNRYDEQSVILADVAVHNRRTRIGSRTVGAQQFFRQGSLQVGHRGFLKS